MDWTLCLLLALAPAGGDKAGEPIRLGQPVNKLAVPSLHRTSIAFSPNGKRLAWVHHLADVAPNDGGSLVIHVWDLEKRVPISEMKPNNQFTYASSPVAFLPNGSMLALGCFQLTTEHELLAKPGTVIKNNVRIWLLAGGRELPFINREDGTTDDAWQAIGIGKDGKAMVGVNSKGGRVWKLPDGEVGRKFELEPANDLIAAPDGKMIAGTVKDKSVRVWKTEDGNEMLKLPEGGKALGFSPDSKHIATVHGEKLCLWDSDNGKQLWALPAKLGKDEPRGPRFDFSPDGKRLAWNDDGNISVADAGTGKVSMTLKGQPGPLAFSPDGQRLALACPDGTALVWQFAKK